LATWFAKRDACVFLVDPFAEFGDLPSPSKEAAFARRHKVRDLSYVDALEGFIRRRHVSGVVGFCLGGLFIFDLARRGVSAKMVSLYGFPQGMANQDPLPVPFDYLEGLPASHVALFGEADYLQTPQNLEQLQAIARRTPAFSVKIYPKSGHGFLADLDNEDPLLRSNAQDALLLCGNALAPCRDAAVQ
jgi:carboxymethylenebutenolidase